jgi:hypothetical protein
MCPLPCVKLPRRARCPKIVVASTSGSCRQREGRGRRGVGNRGEEEEGKRAREWPQKGVCLIYNFLCLQNET